MSAWTPPDDPNPLEILNSARDDAVQGRHAQALAKHLTHDVATLVGLLALNRRSDEVARARDEALKVIDDTDFRALLDGALTGHLPPPLFEAVL